MYRNLHIASKKTGWIRLSGLGVDVASGVMTIATRVALIGESVIKGVGNIFAAPFFNLYTIFERCSMKVGFTQLFFVLPKNIIFLSFSVFSAALGLISKTFYMAKDPVKYTNERWCFHDPEEAKAQKAVLK